MSSRSRHTRSRRCRCKTPEGTVRWERRAVILASGSEGPVIHRNFNLEGRAIDDSRGRRMVRAICPSDLD